MSLTRNQTIAIIIAVLSVLSGGTAQLTEIFGPLAAKSIVSLTSLATAVLSAVMAVLTSQGNTVQEVQSMPGVEKITVNAGANKTLATLAVDPANSKIEASPGAVQAVNQTASVK